MVMFSKESEIKLWPSFCVDRLLLFFLSSFCVSLLCCCLLNHSDFIHNGSPWEKETDKVIVLILQQAVLVLPLIFSILNTRHSFNTDSFIYGLTTIFWIQFWYFKSFHKYHQYHTVYIRSPLFGKDSLDSNLCGGCAFSTSVFTVYC